MTRMVGGFEGAFRINWSILTRCNFDCSYCFPGAHDNVSDIPDVDRLCSAVDPVLNEVAKKKVSTAIYTVTGGEPFLVKDIDRLFKKIKDHPMNTEIVCISNGSMPDRIYLKAFDYIDELVISWHFEEDKDDKYKSLIISLLSNGITSFSVKILEHPDHIERVEQAVKFCKEKGASFSPSRLVLSPDHALYESVVKLSDEMKEDASSLINSTMQETDSYYIEIRNGEKSKKVNPDYYVASGENSFIGWKCYAGLERVCIEPDGSCMIAQCGQGGFYCNVFDDFYLPDNPVICKQLSCNCISDLFATKSEI